MGHEVGFTISGKIISVRAGLYLLGEDSIRLE